MSKAPQASNVNENSVSVKENETLRPTVSMQPMPDGRVSTTNSFKKKPYDKGGKQRKQVDFISTAGVLINKASVAGVVVVNSEMNNGVIIFDQDRNLCNWQKCETHEQAVDEFNNILGQIGVREDTLCVEDQCLINFNLIKSVSEKSGDDFTYLVIDGYDRRPLTMFSSEHFRGLDELKSMITRILMKEQPNEMIKFND